MHRNHGVQMRREPWWYVETHATHKCGEPPLCSVHNQHMEEGSNIGGVHSSTYFNRMQSARECVLPTPQGSHCQQFV